MHGLVQEIAALIAGTCMVRVFDASGYRPPPPARKRRDRVTPLAEVRDALAVRELREALALRPDTPVMDWMSGTDVILELWNRDGAQHATIGLLSPDQLRHDDGELRLLDPGKAARWLALGAEYRAEVWHRRPPRL
ncbi:hypothetical protein CS0771_55370 [Catellatospora sp. IY07-71]|uniref:hypothetical protein n=1 Tax=Catellatospora sp. IY07-71 TaxID=2728827 RepID=UPI001BB3AA8A|nr:hypothetical protein [Catellatospora sp. IY07-71]BCJ75993.1 hypothetical protein CS0771_55370 [Catellatospora sp. IY07-71]